MKTKSDRPSSAKGSKPMTSIKQINHDSQAMRNRTAAFESNLLAAETIQLESFIKNRSKFLDEEIEKMRLKLHEPSTLGTLKVDNNRENPNRSSNGSAVHYVNHEGPQRRYDSNFDDINNRRPHNHTDEQNNNSRNDSDSRGAGIREVNQRYPSPEEGRFSSNRRADPEERGYRDREGFRGIDNHEDMMNRSKGRSDPTGSRQDSRYDNRLDSGEKRISSPNNFRGSGRGLGSDERKSENYSDDYMKKSFQMDRSNEEREDDRNNFDSGTFSVMNPKTNYTHKNISMFVSQGIYTVNSQKMKNLFERITYGKFKI